MYVVLYLSRRMQEVELEKQRSGQKPLTKDTAVGVLQRVYPISEV